MKQVYALRLMVNQMWFAVVVCFFWLSPDAQAQVSGVVFRDFDLNGIRSDTLPVEVGVAGVTVRAFVDLSTIPLLTTTRSDGTFSFNSTSVPAGKNVRVEFDNLPAGNYNGPFGTGSGTTVRFALAPDAQVNVGISYPTDYCQKTGVRLATPCYINGNTNITTDANGDPVPLDKQAGQSPGIITFAYEASGVASDSNFPPNHIANAAQVGSIWGMAYQRRTKSIFTGAVVKRHMSFGPLGTGGIYQTHVPTQTTAGFVDVKTLGIDTGDDPHTILSADKSQTSVDPGPMVAMGRVGFGGMDMSEDDKTIYFINLKDRRLYGLFVNSPAVTPTSTSAVKSWAIPDPGCSNGDFRPWALKVYHGYIYVGLVCSAETSQQQADLSATIYRFDPKAATPVFENILSFPINFKRGQADATFDTAHPENACTQYDHWLPWTNAWPTPCGQGDSPTFVIHPQPILTDLAFDDDGSMIIGFLDRFGHLVTVGGPDPQGNGAYDGFSGGDILRAYNDNGTLVLESNGKAGNRTGSGVGNGEGPGGGEFYGEDRWFFINHYGHSEVTNGALTFIPGYTEIITSAFDPIQDLYKTSGIKVFNNKDGTVNRNYLLVTNSEGSFGKASALGGSKALCDPASVEIGNRVWYDDNRDGIQDAYEPGIDGVVLTLHDMADNGAQVGTQTTHDGGQFYFNNTTVPTGLQYNHAYEIRMDTTQLPLLDLSFKDNKPTTTSNRRSYTLSPANRGTFTSPDLRDSDAHMSGTSAVIAVTTLDAGQNDFTFDMSVYSCPVLKAQYDTVRVCAGSIVDSIRVNGQHFSRIDSVRFVLFSSPQSGTAAYSGTGTVLGTVLPDANGHAVLNNPIINTTNNSSVTTDQYVYGIVFPIPEDPNCRQTTLTVIEVSPAVSVSATGGQLTCLVKEVTLHGQVYYRDGAVASHTAYSWTGPNSFSSSLQNPTVAQAGSYTLTAGNPDCPTSFTSIITQVTASTLVPVLTTSVIDKKCLSCQATLTATAPNATFAWTGPASYSAAGNSVQVTTAGTYTVVATGSNGCSVSADVVLKEYACPDPTCLPLIIKRTK